MPAQWTASFWTTLDASVNAAKYGAVFEQAAERALMYFFFPAELGAIICGAVALFVVWGVPAPPSVTPTESTTTATDLLSLHRSRRHPGAPDAAQREVLLTVKGWWREWHRPAGEGHRQMMPMA